MAFVRKKRKKNQDYFYIVESYRENGKPRQRILEYIGTLENLMSYALHGWQADQQNEEDPISFKAYMHGSCMAMYGPPKIHMVGSCLALRLRMVDTTIFLFGGNHFNREGCGYTDCRTFGLLPLCLNACPKMMNISSRSVLLWVL